MPHLLPSVEVSVLVHTDSSSDIKYLKPEDVHIPKSGRIVAGYATVEVVDSENELISVKGVLDAFPQYMAKEGGLLYYNHSIHCGKVISYYPVLKGDKPAVFIVAVIDEGDPICDWIWSRAPYCKGFSIRGAKLSGNGNTVESLVLKEISIVDLPVNPEATLEFVNVVKGSSMDVLKKRLRISCKGTDTPIEVQNPDVVVGAENKSTAESGTFSGQTPTPIDSKTPTHGVEQLPVSSTEQLPASSTEQAPAEELSEEELSITLQAYLDLLKARIKSLELI